ncbi:MAG: 4'-phosphopantetheinyl transferase superfamily protein [Ruminococcus flavefaciens]|nr:4'-phosphopantetheinyl transferase superfamily protein [Ruminococcus flavefaciens]
MISIKDIPRGEQHAHAHKLLRECLKPLNIAYSADTAIAKNKYGKPSLADFPDVKYNISHADGICACIISKYECGIDCESVREYRPLAMKRAFSEDEKNTVLSAVEAERDMLFFRLWTLKEAYIKAVGMGLSFPMNQANFSFEGNKIHSNITDCRFRQYILRDGKFIVAVCEQIVNISCES